MKKTDWQKIAKASADSARVQYFINSLAEGEAQPQLEKFPAASAPVLAAVLSGSQFLGELLVATPALLSIFEHLEHPRRVEGIRREIKSFVEPKLTTRE